MNRIISLSVEDMYIKYTGEAFGATGSHNAVTLRMTFGPAWDGTAKTAYFTDALGNTSVALVLGLDTLADGAYEVDVPSEALKTAGVATITIKGVLVSGETTTKAITTAAGHFRVLDSELPDSAGNAGTITPSDKDQLQAEIAGMEALFTTAKAAAEAAAANAKVSETNAKTSETAAASSASSAEASKTAAANSSATATAQASTAKESAAQAAESQAAAKSSKNAAKISESAAKSAQSGAEAAEANAKNSATEAAGAARSASGAAVVASGSASDAKTSATAASSSASQAQASAAAAAQSAASVDGINKTAQSWAVGGTNTRPGEDTDNAKYWAEQAQAVGDITTHNQSPTAHSDIRKALEGKEASGTAADAVSAHNKNASAHTDIRNALNGKEPSGTAATAVAAHNTDKTAHADIREAVSKAGKPFIIEGTLGDANSDGFYQITGVSKSRAEVKAAVQTGELVTLHLGLDGNYIDLALTQFGFTDDTDFYYFGAIMGGVLVAQLHYVDTQYDAMLNTASIPPLSDDAPSAPGTASAGTSYKAARADHVHPSERPKAAQVTLTAAGWNASTKKQTVTVSGVLADTSKQVIWVAFASEAALDAYMDAGIVPVAQGANTVTFRADKAPTTDIAVTVLMQEVSA